MGITGVFIGNVFGRNRSEGDDLLGDAYEYLMRHFATESGKSKGQFYTPAEVSRVMAQVLGLGTANRADQSIYDPTCGSGSLLLKAHDEAKSRTGLDLALYGQEMDNATSALARMNMVLHDCPTAEIWQSNTLAAPHFKNTNGRLKTFDFMVANPPFSNKNWTSGLDFYGRFEYGIPPTKNGDYAFLLHMLASLKSTGKGAVILPHGVLFRGNAEAGIRKRIVKQGYIKGIIGLPANLFYGTGIPACILVLDKEHAAARAAGHTGIFMIDASKGFIKDGNKNRLRAQDIHKIVDTFTRQLEIAKYARRVPLAEIETNDFNLNLPRYIDSTEAEDWQDIEAHLRGDIPNRDVDNLAAYWDVFPGVRHELFAPFSNTGVSLAHLKTLGNYHGTPHSGGNDRQRFRTEEKSHGDGGCGRGFSGGDS
jgi:type I restriction enzyme M protein